MSVLINSMAPYAVVAAKEKDYALNREIWRSEPKYYPTTGSYYQLIDDKKTTSQGIDWETAAEHASEMIYKNRRGRLAIINTPEHYSWLLETFQLQTRVGNYEGTTWIGLKYVCKSGRLQWVDGREHPRTAFNFWGVPWYRDDGIRCNTQHMSYMSIYIYGPTLHWQATGPAKRFPHYLVEYPPNPGEERDNGAFE